MVNVTIYTIHGSYGILIMQPKLETPRHVPMEHDGTQQTPSKFKRWKRNTSGHSGLSWLRCNPVELCGSPPLSVWLFNLISGTSSEFTKTSAFSLVELHRRWTGLLSIEKLWATVEIYGFSLPEMIQWWRKSSASLGQHPNQCPCGNKSSQPLWLKPEANWFLTWDWLIYIYDWTKIPPQHFSIISPWSWMNQNFICCPISLIGFPFLWVVMLPNKAAYNSLVALVHQARSVFSMPRMGVCQVSGVPQIIQSSWMTIWNRPLSHKGPASRWFASAPHPAALATNSWMLIQETRIYIIYNI